MIMSKKAHDYRYSLIHHKAHRNYLLNNSGLPGKRANLELAKAFAQTAGRALINNYASITAKEAPQDTPDEFLSFCGVLGLGRLAMEGKDEALAKLRASASDKRWRIREAVAMALHMIGNFDMAWLIGIAREWIKGDLFEQRAAIAGICEPDLLWDESFADSVFQLLDKATQNIENEEHRDSEGFRVLKKGLAYCWSVAVAAYPDQGKSRMEQWAETTNKDVRWIIKQNLKKNRLVKMDPNWVSAMDEKVNPQSTMNQ